MQPVYLVKIEAGENNNKFYRMVPDGANFRVEYGRIGNSNFATDTYPIGRWDTQYRSKIKKGYVDKTELVAETFSVAKSKQYKDIVDNFVADIVKRLQQMAKQAIEENYTISSAKVTQRMITEAQGILNNLSSTKNLYDFNLVLVELFRVIPRKMKTVAENLAKVEGEFGNIVQREQDLLDTMKGQVVTQVAVDTDDVDIPDQTLLDVLGIQLFPTTPADVLNIKNHLGNIADKYHQSWQVVNNKTQVKFDQFVKDNNITNKKLLWHGSRNENWWSIINTGLLLRPNAQITGKMYGNGCYYSPDSSKSLNYTSINGSYWAKGQSNSGIMALFDVAVGKQYDVYSYDNYGNFDWNKLQSKAPGSQCLYAHGGTGMLRKDEVVVYREDQMTIKYLVEVK